LAAFTDALAKRGGAAVPNSVFSGGAAKGLVREVYVAESDAEARRIAKPAHDHLYHNQTYLRREHDGGRFSELGITFRPTHRAGDYDDALREGTTIAGTPENVRAEIARQVDATGANYFIGYFMFGTMTLADALRSFNLFTTEVKPHFETVAAR
jgi:alkanesulfonate monooxygenase SsuD/methylene tetrahydromethanopterin reductase-like flavin-dependent oxidoreductase (luciferase family)